MLEAVRDTVTEAAAEAPASSAPPRPLHPVTQYARDVVDGKLAGVGRLERLACERHLRDLEHGAARGLVFDEAKADHGLRIFPFLRHWKGRWAGKPVILDGWQVFIVGSLFGWMRVARLVAGALQPLPRPRRRFRFSYTEVARKNGKSTKAAGIALKCLIADDEPGAEVYSAATKREQARIVFRDASMMGRRSPGLARRLDIQGTKIAVVDKDTGEPEGSVFSPLSHDDKTMDGLNVHCAILDELHAHKTRGVFDVMKTGIGAREQPLIFIITTAGDWSPNSICVELRGYCENVLEGIYADASADEWFAYVATIDKGDDWTDEACWPKANPALRTGVLDIDVLRTAAALARQTPAAQTAFRQKHLNEWVTSAERAIDMQAWAACAEDFDLDALKGRPCFFGVDLAKVGDLTALALLFLPTASDPLWRFDVRFWCPEVDIIKRSRDQRVPYVQWREDGWIETTPGDWTDFGFLEAAVLEEAKNFQMRELAYDMHFAHELIQRLQQHFGEKQLVGFGQGFISMGKATSFFMREFGQHRIRHRNNPVLNWCASNLVFKKDEADNMKPDKKRSREKIDGMVALFNAAGRACLGDKGVSVYAERGLVVL